MYVRFGGGCPETCRRKAIRRCIATLLKILIIVVIGAAILAIMNTAMPALFQSLIDKVSSQITGITILP